MPRPRKWRRVQAQPKVTYFKPGGVPARNLGEVVLPVEGLEALRLADLDKVDHEDAAVEMGISRPTFSRVLSAARSAVAEALVQGLAIRIEGGDFFIQGPPMRGFGRFGRQRRGRGGGRGGSHER
ncbi:MAG: DUF134 domain-containing protein [Deltaproteobacteria bacterium]|nr:DUF134 domain-containing protein [Deltaproteobacteria bacterium]MBW2051306.1 DUF134 domain-containing protein [Deltaproteobacteria bacterium]MBW2140372.1 DUF134 domain-containing protein [Deltaproteobacteria bacterium]MBW2323225.1 DUF134 domain-containing protein [Deltaproteobacteria bacterium]